MTTDSETAARVRFLLEGGHHAAAAEECLRTYGPGLRRFLRQATISETQADDAFAIACEDIWSGLRSFDWSRGMLKSWCYVLARHAARRLQREAARARQRAISLDPDADLEAFVARARESTATYKKTESHEALARLREQLDPDDRALLSLRLESRMEWSQIAVVLGVSDHETVARASARLRKRFERVCKRLEALAREAGIVATDDDG